MTWAIEQINAWSATWAELTLAILWQSTLIGLGLGLLAHWLPKSSPAVRCWLWQIVALKLLLMPFWVMAAPLPSWVVPIAQDSSSGPPTAASSAVAPRTMAGATTTTLPAATTRTAMSPEPAHWVAGLSGTTCLLSLWLVAVIWQTARIVRQSTRLTGLLRMAVAADDRMVAIAQTLVRQLGLTHVPSLLVVDADCPPFVCGVWKPRVVLSKKLVETFDENRLRQVLLHELSHVRRRDLAWGWLSEAARILYFFHPLAHWAYHQIRLERELACDQIAITSGGGNVPDYAGTLATVARQTSIPTRRRLSVLG